MGWSEDGDVLILAVGRQLDAISSKEFEDEIEAGFVQRCNGKKKLLLNFANTTYVSSAGLRVLLMTHKKMEKAGIFFALTAINPSIREVLDMTGFSDFLHLE